MAPFWSIVQMAKTKLKVDGGLSHIFTQTRPALQQADQQAHYLLLCCSPLFRRLMACTGAPTRKLCSRQPQQQVDMGSNFSGRFRDILRFVYVLVLRCCSSLRYTVTAVYCHSPKHFAFDT